MNRSKLKRKDFIFDQQHCMFCMRIIHLLIQTKSYKKYNTYFDNVAKHDHIENFFYK